MVIVVAMVQVKQQVEEERVRQLRESKDLNSALNKERNRTYDRLVVVQEQLLHQVRGLKVGTVCRGVVSGRGVVSLSLSLCPGG